MSRYFTKRLPVKILTCYIDCTDTSIRSIVLHVLDPHTLEFTQAFFRSGDLVEEKLSIKTITDKTEFFIKSMNSSGTETTLPDLIVWDKAQYNTLLGLVPNLHKLVKPHIVILQNRLYEIFKHDLRLQGFSLNEIGEVMNIYEEHPNKTFAKIAQNTERLFRENARSYRRINAKSKA